MGYLSMNLGKAMFPLLSVVALALICNCGGKKETEADLSGATEVPSDLTSDFEIPEDNCVESALVVNIHRSAGFSSFNDGFDPSGSSTSGAGCAPVEVFAWDLEDRSYLVRLSNVSQSQQSDMCHYQASGIDRSGRFDIYMRWPSRSRSVWKIPGIQISESSDGACQTSARVVHAQFVPSGGGFSGGFGHQHQYGHNGSSSSHGNQHGSGSSYY